MIGKLAAVRKMEGCRAWNRKELGRHRKFALPPAKNRNTRQKEFFFLNNLRDSNHDIGHWTAFAIFLFLQSTINKRIPIVLDPRCRNSQDIKSFKRLSLLYPECEDFMIYRLKWASSSNPIYIVPFFSNSIFDLNLNRFCVLLSGMYIKYSHRPPFWSSILYS